MAQLKLNVEMEELISLLINADDSDFNEIFDRMLIYKIESAPLDSIEAESIYNTIKILLKY